MYNVNIHTNYSTGLKQEAIDLEKRSLVPTLLKIFGVSHF